MKGLAEVGGCGGAPSSTAYRNGCRCSGCTEHMRKVRKEEWSQGALGAVSVCKTEGCDLPVRRNRNGHGMGYCEGHYNTRGVRFRATGDRWAGRDGYIQTKTSDGRVIAEHRYVMELALGRALAKGESVHHINGDRSDNRIENLELWFSPQPYGQRVGDLLAYVAENHADAITVLIGAQDEGGKA